MTAWLLMACLCLLALRPWLSSRFALGAWVALCLACSVGGLVAAYLEGA